MTLSPRNMISKAIMNLQVHSPFFSYLLLHIDYVKSDKMDFMGKIARVSKDGTLEYGPDGISKLSQEELQGVLMHEVLHLGLGHFYRGTGKIWPIWGIATDVVVNNIVVSENVSLPDGAIIDETYRDCSAEEVYKDLVDKIDRIQICSLKSIDECDNADECPLSDECVSGFDVHDEVSKGEMADAKRMLRKWRDRMVEAKQYAKRQGKGSRSYNKLVDDLYDSSIDWISLLWKFVSSDIMVDYTWQRPSNIYYSQGIYLPSEYKESLNICVAVDTSGSISREELGYFKTEILSIARSFSGLNVTIIEHTDEVTDTFELNDYNIERFMEKPTAETGGTNHLPVFEWIKEHQPESRGVVCLTDGWTVTPTSFQIPTLWVTTGKKERIKFGKIVEMELE